MRSFFRDVPDTLWRSYRWQVQNRIKTLEEVSSLLDLTPEEIEGIKRTRGLYSFAITPYYFSLIDPEDPRDPIRLQCIPRVQEVDDSCQVGGEENPFNEERYVEGLTHRYPDRVLLNLTTFCPVYCRHCMRKRIFKEGERAVSKDQILAFFEYISGRREVREVILSGGEPLSLSEDKLEFILKGLRSIRHVEIIRINTRMPVLAPQRFFEPSLVRLLERYSPLWINTHFNHPKEITPESEEAIDTLLRAGIPVNNQAVLLKGVNDNEETIKALVEGLIRIKVNPVYLFFCDPVKGAMHFRTEIGRGTEIIRYLFGRVSGYAIPMYVVDLPGGRGKVPLMPSFVASGNGEGFTFEAPLGGVVNYGLE